MKRLLGLAAVLLLIPVLSAAEKPKLKKMIIFPFTVSETGPKADVRQ